VIVHVVLMTPRPDLGLEERGAFIEAFERAVRQIPSVRDVRVGRRVKHGANYESLAPDAGAYVATIGFDDLAGLQAYLRHPAHEELGARFYQALASAMVFDYEVGGIELLREI